MITTEFCTSIYPELSLVVDKDKFSQKDIDSYIDKNRKILEQDNHYLELGMTEKMKLFM